MPRAILGAVLFAVLPACVVQRTVDNLQENSPPPEFGRPGWVRGCAGTGAWIGGIVGGVLSVVVLPITYPITLLAGDSLSPTAREEFMLFPATGLAATGHFLFGAPPDLLDWTFRRAWTGDGMPVNTYEVVPMQPPAPVVTPPPAQPTAPAPTQPPTPPAVVPGTDRR